MLSLHATVQSSVSVFIFFTAGSRMKKNWVMLVKKSDTTELSKEPLLLTDVRILINFWCILCVMSFL